MLASINPLEPSRTLGILFGASRWPLFPDVDSEKAAAPYAEAAESIKKYLTGEEGLALPQANILNLFDKKMGVVDQDKAIRKFLKARVHQTATITDVIIVFIGHGSTMIGRKFIFILGSTDQEQRDITAYKSESLARALKDEAPILRKWLFLDCCAAAAAYGDFQPAQSASDVLEEEVAENFPESGTALYSACSSDAAAYNDPKAGSRMFTAALTDVLGRGYEKYGEFLTLSEVARLVRVEIKKRHGPDGVLPTLGDPDTRWGELSAMPFFPNAARRKTSADAKLEKMQATITNLEDAQEKLKESVGEIKLDIKTLSASLSKSDTSSSPATGGQDRIDPEYGGLVAGLSLDEARNWDRAEAANKFSMNLLVAGAICAAAQAALFILLQYSRLDPLFLPIVAIRLLYLAAALILVLSAFVLSSFLYPRKTVIWEMENPR